ncbi:hypothetical protein [Candidatus Poriferisodalis sp.]|uniref:hypothetical protein n=1 Tax=Candidatus Poriferisodalis sp. TaxID=3101277 RepID=UPI003C6F34EA
MASQSCCEVIGVIRWRMPRCDTASTTALWTAGMAPIVPDAPKAANGLDSPDTRRPDAPAAFLADEIDLDRYYSDESLLSAIRLRRNSRAAD